MIKGIMIFCYLLVLSLGIHNNFQEDLSELITVESWFQENHPQWGADIFVYDRFQENLDRLRIEDWKKFVNLFQEHYPNSPLVPEVLFSKSYLDFKNGIPLVWNKIDEPSAKIFFSLLLQHHPQIEDQILLTELKKYLISRPLQISASSIVVKIFEHLNKNQAPLYEKLPEYMGNDEEAVFRCAWIFYRLERYSAAKPLFSWLRQRKVHDALFYLGTIELRQYSYVSAIELLQKYLYTQGKHPFRSIKSIDTHLPQHHYAAALYQNGNLEKAYQYLQKVPKKEESLTHLFLKISRKLKKNNVPTLVHKFQKRFPTSRRTKKMRRSKALQYLQHGNSEGLRIYKAIYPNYKEDHQVLEFLSLNTSKTKTNFGLLQDPFYDYFARQKEFSPHAALPTIYKSWIEEDQKEIKKWIASKSSTLPELKKPIYLSNEKYRMQLTTQLSPFFSQYYQIFVDKDLILRIDAFCKRDMESIAKSDIRIRCAGDEIKEFYYRQELYGSCKKYRSSSVEMTSKLLAEKVFYHAPYELLRKAFPLCYLEAVKKISSTTKVEPELIYAVMRAESFFDNKAFSSSGAMGLMQLMPNTAKQIYKSKNFFKQHRWDLFDPELNIFLGVTHLEGLMKHFQGNIFLSAAAYNAGRTAAERWIKNETKEVIDWLKFCMFIEYEETHFYVQKVIRNYQMYQILYGKGLKNAQNLSK